MTPTTSNDWKPIRRTLCVGVNWIGDTVMSFPAVQAWRRAHPDAHLSVLVKKNLAPLWELHSACDNILTFEDSNAGTFAAGKSLRSGRFERAVILPNSFRSALVPFLARIPERIGTPGQLRSLLLTKKVTPDSVPGCGHQAGEYFGLLGLAIPAQIEPPRLKISDGARERAMSRLENLPRPLVGLIPGAARGPSKRWPAEHFAEVGRRLASERGCGIALFGGGEDAELCGQICGKLGADALNLAGKTSLKEWVALLSCCDLVVCNDSGGMHLAAAVGTPLVAIYGLTDPAKTGPLGGRCMIVRDETVAASRDIARDSGAARKSLVAISPLRVFEIALALLPARTG